MKDSRHDEAMIAQLGECAFDNYVFWQDSKALLDFGLEMIMAKAIHQSHGSGHASEREICFFCGSAMPYPIDDAPRG
jgi:hypothetical protein